MLKGDCMENDFLSLRQFLEAELFEIVEKRRGQIKPVEDIGQEELAYVAGLMMRFVDMKYFTQHYTNSPLYDLALRQNSAMPKPVLTGLGDFCLFRTGFFPLGFQAKRSAPRKNFILAGQKTYWLVADNQNQALEMFRSLALNFLIFSNLLSEIRLRYMSEQELVELYELWQETGSEFAQDAIRKKGIVPQRFVHVS